MLHPSTAHFSPKPVQSNLWTSNTSKQSTAKQNQTLPHALLFSFPKSFLYRPHGPNEIWSPRESTLKFLTVEEGKFAFRWAALAINHCSSIHPWTKTPYSREGQAVVLCNLYGPLWRYFSPVVFITTFIPDPDFWFSGVSESVWITRPAPS